MDLLIYGIHGYMGKLIKRLAGEDPYWQRIEGMDVGISRKTLDERYDVVVDFQPSVCIG